MVSGGIDEQSWLQEASSVSSMGSVKSDGESDARSVVASGHADEGSIYSSSGSEDRLVGPMDAGDGFVSAVPSGSVLVPVGEGSVYSKAASMVSVECTSLRLVENELIGAVTVAKPLAISARKDSQA
jgi:hypothetical protein